MPAPVGLSVHAKGREKLKGHLAMLLFAVLIAGSFSFGGLAARYMEAEPLTLWRYMMTIAVMAALAFGAFRVPTVWPKQAWRFLFLGALIAIYMLTMFMALEFTSPISTGAVFTLMPLMSAGFALPVLGQKTRPGVLAGLVIAAAGAVYAQSGGATTSTNPIARGEEVFANPMNRSQHQTFGRGVFDNTGIGRPTPRNQVQVTPVPEPSQWAMLIAGLAMVGFIVRRNSRKTQD